MKNLKKLAAGTAIALVIGVSAFSGSMNAGIVNADEPTPDQLVLEETRMMGNFEIQDLMSRYTEAQTLAKIDEMAQFEVQDLMSRY